jgi:hypothetical protein
MSRYDSQRRAIAQAAPVMPDQMPTPLRNQRRVDALFPIVQKQYNTDEDFRKLASGTSIEDSPSKRLCYDDAQLAMKAQAAIRENGANAILDELPLGTIGTLVKYCLRRVGLARSQRIAAAKNNLLSAASQPAE